MGKGTTFQIGKSRIHRPKREWSALRRNKANQEETQNTDKRREPTIACPKGKKNRSEDASN